MAAFLLLLLGGSQNYYSKEQPSTIIDFVIVERSLRDAIFIVFIGAKQFVKSSLEGNSIRMILSGFQSPGSQIIFTAIDQDNRRL
jgi:hypothetical protein